MTHFKQTFSNLDKLFWPEGITKGDLLDYYLKISPFIIPHLKNRPMVLNRHPNGILGEHFFQKQAPKELPDWIKTWSVEHSERTVDYILVQDVHTLLYVINLGCIELNPFLSRVSRQNPDYMVIDLDPEDVKFELMREVCFKTHEILDEIGADNYCKTSGGRGLHIYVPLNGKYTFKQSQDFAHILGLVLRGLFPNLVSLKRSPSQRPKQIYVDYLRNSTHQTLASVYCVRPKEHATVSTPLEWAEVKKPFEPKDFNIFTVLKRLEKRGDIFRPVIQKGINLKSSLKKLAEKYGSFLTD